MTFCDLEWLSKIFNDTKRRAVSLRQLNFLLDIYEQELITMQVNAFIRHNSQKSHDAPKKSPFAIEIGERYGEIEYRGGKVLQRWHGLGDNCHLYVTYAYVIYCWVCCFLHDDVERRSMYHIVQLFSEGMFDVLHVTALKFFLCTFSGTLK